VLEHLNGSGERPARVVVLGAAGFVGGAIVERLARAGTNVLALGRADVDLLAADASERLIRLFEPTDAVVAASAAVPCVNPDMVVENMIIARSIVSALAAYPVSHVINISSDAVYADCAEPLGEASCASPASLHGAMHLAREVMFRTAVSVPLATLRPTLLYGAGDTHNGYGPNRFMRSAKLGRPIALFGEGEERRDHVFIDDVAEIVRRVLDRRSRGVLNVATGVVSSFRELADRVAALAGGRGEGGVSIEMAPRSGPMPHNGYRPFNTDNCREAFPDFRYTSLDSGLAQTWTTIRAVPGRG
jgi:UDP-glucose 4-epimerase